MSGSRKQEQAAMEAVARHVSGSWEKGEGPPDAFLTIVRKRIAVEIANLKQPIAGGGSVTEPRLRFDRVAQGLVRRLQAALDESVPEGKTVIVTVTAPIWQAGKTAAALEEMVRTSLASRSARAAVKDEIHGNQVRVRVVKGGSRGMSKVIGLVHNPDRDIEVLLDIMESLIAGISAKAAPARFAGERWLVLASEERLSPIELYRLACSQLSLPAGFKKILMVLAGGRVETLSG